MTAACGGVLAFGYLKYKFRIWVERRQLKIDWIEQVWTTFSLESDD
jgi:hypothetical protein